MQKYKFYRKESLFFIAYFLLGLTNIVIGNSYLFGAERFTICKVVQYIAAFFFVFSFVAGKYSVKELLARFLIVMIVSLVTIRNHSIDFGLAALSIVSSLNIDTEKIVKNCLRNNIFFIAIVVIPALCGFIPNDTYDHYGVAANCFGFAYYSNLPNIIFSMILALYFLAKNKRQETFILIASIPVQLVIYKYCTVRLILYLFMFFLITAFLTNFYNNRKTHRILTWIATFMFPGACLVTIASSLLYTRFDLLSKVNVLLNYRLGFNAIGLSKYGISLFGTKIESVSEMWDSNNINHYFYIDSGYVNSLISYGILFFLLLIVAYMRLSRDSIKSNNIKLAVWCFIICAYSIVNNLLFNVALNPLPMIAFNFMWNYRNKIKKGKCC